MTDPHCNAKNENAMCEIKNQKFEEIYIKKEPLEENIEFQGDIIHDNIKKEDTKDEIKIFETKRQKFEEIYFTGEHQYCAKEKCIAIKIEPDVETPNLTCSICTKTFLCSYWFEVHMKWHSMFNKTYKTKDNLTNQKAQHHKFYIKREPIVKNDSNIHEAIIQPSNKKEDFIIDENAICEIKKRRFEEIYIKKESLEENIEFQEDIIHDNIKKEDTKNEITIFETKRQKFEEIYSTGEHQYYGKEKCIAIKIEPDDETPNFTCSICSKTFIYSYWFEVHMKWHSTFNKTYKTTENLTNQNAQHHKFYIKREPTVKINSNVHVIQESIKKEDDKNCTNVTEIDEDHDTSFSSRAWPSKCIKTYERKTNLSQQNVQNQLKECKYNLCKELFTNMDDFLIHEQIHNEFDMENNSIICDNLYELYLTIIRKNIT